MWPLRSGSGSHTLVIDTLGYFGTIPNISIALASAAWPTTNKILYCPIRVPSPLTVLQMYTNNGTTVSGNVDVGIYTLDGTRLMNSGSVAQSGTSAIQTINTTDVTIGPGVFYLALQVSNTTATFVRGAPLVAQMSAYGVLMEAAGGFGLPALATFATAVDAYFPPFGLVAAGNF